MPQPIVRIDPTRVSVEPGSQVTVSVSVYNPGTVVEGYDLAVLAGVPTPWATVSPDTLSIYPQQEGTAVVTFAPPGGPGAPGGSLPFAVRAQSKLDPAMSAVAEGDLEVGAVAGLTAQLTPVTSSGRWRGRHTVTIGNVGNLPARLRVSAQDPDQALGFLVSPPVVDVPVRGRAVARVKVRTRHPVLRGQPQRLPFQVVCEPDAPQGFGAPAPGPRVSTPERPVVDGAFNQKPILTKAVVAVASLLVVAVVGGGLYALLKPSKTAAPEVHPAAAPTGLSAIASPGKVTLRWDVTTGVDSYELVQTDPVNDTVTAPPAKDPTNPNLYIVTLAVKTADRYCYEVLALRKGAPKSEASDRACTQAVLTAAQSAAPSPTSSPTMEVLTPSGGGTDKPLTTPVSQSSVVVPIDNGDNGLDLYVVDPDGTQQSLLGDVPGDQDLPSVSPDHTTIQYRSTPQVGTDQGWVPYVYQIGGRALPLFSAPPPPGVQCDGRLAWDPSTSNTGVILCFDANAQSASAGGTVRNVYTATTQDNGQVDGSTMQVVPGFPADVGMSNLSVTATGGIVLSYDHGPSVGVWYLAPGSSSAVRLTSGDDSGAIAAPVGTLVAFQRAGDLMVVDTGKQPFACAGSTLTDTTTTAPLCRLTSDPATFDASPAWSWDGNTIAFRRAPAQGEPATLMALDPNNPTAVQPFAPQLGTVGESLAWAPR